MVGYRLSKFAEDIEDPLTATTGTYSSKHSLRSRMLPRTTYSRGFRSAAFMASPSSHTTEWSRYQAERTSPDIALTVQLPSPLGIDHTWYFSSRPYIPELKISPTSTPVRQSQDTRLLRKPYDFPTGTGQLIKRHNYHPLPPSPRSRSRPLPGLG